MAERNLSNGELTGNFAKTFPEGTVITAIKTGTSPRFNTVFGVATTEDGKQYSISGTAAKILLEAISSGKLALPARIKMKVVQGKGPYQYTVPVVVE